MTTAGADNGRIVELRATKLVALVGDHVGEQVGPAVGFGAGVALVHDRTAWIYLADAPSRRVGAGLAWALRSTGSSLAIIVDDRADAGIVVRKTEGLSMRVHVWVADGRRLVRYTEPADHVAPRPVREEHLALWPLIVEGGASPVVEHGMLVGEVRGLEVCRVVDDPTTGSARLEVGVGAHDREAFQMLHGDVPTVESLCRIVDEVASQRRAGAPHHPLNRLAPERFLRWELEGDPERVGAATLSPAEPPSPRESLLDVRSCVARGFDVDGNDLVVVCGSGADLELIPDAIDARRAAGIDRAGRLVVATRSGDRLPITDDLAALAGQSLELVSI